MNEATSIILALGSNVGDRPAYLRAAVKALRPYVAITAVSKIYETAAVYISDQPSYLNAALIGTTALDPLTLLWTVKDLERELGRTPSFRYGPRVIDIDIIFYGDRILETPELTLPHAGMSERSFVLLPLNDIAPQWRHPVNGKTVAEMLAVLPDSGSTCIGALL